jgi:hypothetical protein
MVNPGTETRTEFTLRDLPELERVVRATLAARDDIDALLWRRDVRANALLVAQASISRGAMDSAALEGADLAGVEDSPMGKVLSATLAVTAQAPLLADTWLTAPLQVITGLHLLVAKEFSGPDQLGRPRAENFADDPLNIGSIPDHSLVPVLLMSLSRQCVTTQVSAIIEAGFVHAEIMRLRPFTWGSGLVARAVIRTIFAARGLDPSNFSIPENGMFETGRTNYVSAIRAYIEQTPDGVSHYFEWFSACVGMGARAVAVPD